MSQDPLIRLTDVNLSIPTSWEASRTLMSGSVSFLSNLYGKSAQRRHVDILKNLNLTIGSGERVAIMGLNGAGKSTLLRLLAGVYFPTTGTIVRNGTVRGLFDISLGTHPEATGIENIYLRGLQMGIDLRETKDMMKEVSEFSELGEHLNKPFNTYSAGMRMRLILSISTLINPDVLLLDEWIGAGDEAFRLKMKSRMEKMISESKSLVLASHNMYLLRAFCSRAIVVENGSIVFDGEIKSAQEKYTEIYSKRNKIA